MVKHMTNLLFGVSWFSPCLYYCQWCLFCYEWFDEQSRTHDHDLRDTDNHDGVITHLEPDILKCKVKWALGSITTNKHSGSDGIPAELFQILKMMLWKCCTQYASKFGKLNSGYRTGKGQFSFKFQIKAMPKNVQTTTQFHSCHTLAKEILQGSF